MNSISRQSTRDCVDDDLAPLVLIWKSHCSGKHAAKAIEYKQPRTFSSYTGGSLLGTSLSHLLVEECNGYHEHRTHMEQVFAKPPWHLMILITLCIVSNMTKRCLGDHCNLENITGSLTVAVLEERSCSLRNLPACR